MSSPVATQQHIAPSRAEPLNDHLRLSLADHGVGFIVPAGAGGGGGKGGGGGGTGLRD
jgi:hypothetical protein